MDSCLNWSMYSENKVAKKCPQVYELEAENARLKENLIEYGRHAAGCSQEFAKKYRCRCGWDKVEQELKGK